jgi:hypothetical protein
MMLSTFAASAMKNPRSIYDASSDGVRTVQNYERSLCLPVEPTPDCWHRIFEFDQLKNHAAKEQPIDLDVVSPDWLGERKFFH